MLSVVAIAGDARVSGSLPAFGHTKARPVAASAPPEMTVAQVIHRPLREWQEFSGRLQAVNTVEIRPRVSGYVDRVAFEDGARVKKGQLLFQIDPRPFQAEVDRLVAERSRSVSDLELAQGQPRPRRAADQRARHFARGATSAGGCGGVRAGSAWARSMPRLQEARLNREFTEVRAPIDGHVSRAIITAGNLVTSASLLTTLVSDDPVYVYFDADEQTYLRYAKAQRESGRRESPLNRSTSDSSTRRAIRTRRQLDFIDNQVDPATGTIRARAALANPDGRYTPGLFARVRLVGGEDHDSVLIEDRAVGTDLSKKFVLTLTADNRIEYRLVELGPEIDGLRVVKQRSRPERGHRRQRTAARAARPDRRARRASPMARVTRTVSPRWPARAAVGDCSVSSTRPRLARR